LFGLDQFRIVPLTSSTGDLSSARVTVGKQLSRDLFATYSYDPSETEEQIFELEWRVSRSLVLVLTQNGDGTYAADAKWEKVF
jgi:translocation and assembly module TamB